MLTSTTAVAFLLPGGAKFLFESVVLKTNLALDQGALGSVCSFSFHCGISRRGLPMTALISSGGDAIS